ncbi:MAG: 2-succinyl-5-enolpyruvyl-6-hydroxy-3-cyclohexene-1-carboxylate synthase [Aestuariibaculum sp.]
MVYSKIPLAQTVTELCKAKGIKHIVISPGSRNAPLTIGFTSNEYFKCYSIVDERCAAFFALGLAQQLQEPTAVVCSSGSALLNYYPAVSEAFYSDIPLVVLSADRPKHLIGIGDGQTIVQKNVYKNHILYSANLKLDLSEKQENKRDEPPIIKNFENRLERFLGLQKDIQTYNEEEINKAINTAIEKKGPVHINIPFNEPLYKTVEDLSVFPKVIQPAEPSEIIEENILEACLKQWHSATKKMVLVGVNHPNSIEEKWLKILAEDNSVVVFTETTSNLHNDNFFPSIDQIIAALNEDEQQKLSPDILLTFGGLIVSKKIKVLLRKFQPKQHWHIGEKGGNDTFFCLKQHIKTTPNIFFKAFLPKVVRVSSVYYNIWKTVKSYRLQKHREYLEKVPYSDFQVFSQTLKAIPDSYVLQVGNSSAIRYTQLFSINKTVEVFCNRGTSGIDGSTSTAIGCAVANVKPTVFITGDISFFYDSNALWNNYIPNNFRIILINNSGGGIFRILPGHKNTENFDTYFETKHQLTAEHLCKMYGFQYETANNVTDLNTIFKTFYNPANTPKLLEVFTPSRINDRVLLDYFEFIG